MSTRPVRSRMESFARSRRRSPSRRRPDRRGIDRRARADLRPLTEPLESRLAFDVSGFTNVGIASDWTVLTANRNDDLFMQRVATGQVLPAQGNQLLFANNSSFNNYQAIAEIQGYDSLYVTNAARVTDGNIYHDSYPLESGTAPPIVGQPVVTTFVLSQQKIDQTDEINGAITYGGQTWTFTNNVNRKSTPADGDYPGGACVITGAVDPTLPHPVAINFNSAAAATANAEALVTWSSMPVVTPLQASPALSITYDSNFANRVVNKPTLDAKGNVVQDAFFQPYNQDFQTDNFRLPSAGSQPSFTLATTNVHPGGIVPGTLQGTIDINADGLPDFTFAPAELFGPLANTLAFSVGGKAPVLAGAFASDGKARTLTGGYDPVTGVMQLKITDSATGKLQACNGVATILGVTYANYEQGTRPSNATFAPGLDMTNQIFVDLLASGSSINVNSPILQAAGATVAGADITLRASNVNLNAPTQALDRLVVGPSAVAFRDLAVAKGFAVLGTGAQAGQVVRIDVPAGLGGAGYFGFPPIVTITGGGGTGATAHAVVSQDGVVIAVLIDTAGTGYTSPPTITIAPPPAQPFAAYQASPYAVVQGGQVTAIGMPPGFRGQGYDPLVPVVVTVDAPTTPGGVRATAQAVIVNGALTGFVVTNPGNGYVAIPNVTVGLPPDVPPIGPGFKDLQTGQYPIPRITGVAPTAEQLLVNAQVAAQYYDLRLADDPFTAGPKRGRLFVSASGSLSGALSATGTAVATPAQAVFVQADNADVVVEGVVAATDQTYLLQSVQVVNPTTSQFAPQQPFTMTTRSPATGSQTGLIRGTTLAVTMGNDTPTPEDGGSGYNTVDLKTAMDSVRVTAATRQGQPLSGPFPYDLTLTDVDAVTFDAVAASSHPIRLSAGGDVLFNAALATASDLVIDAAGSFTVSAPVSSSRGRLVIDGTSVTVNNSLRVLDPVYDSTATDISLTATAGDIALTGLVSAVNGVDLVQANGAAPGKISGPSRVVADRLRVKSAGSVALFTNVSTLTGSAATGMSIDELDDIAIPSLQSGGLVSLRAGGFDPGLGTRLSPNAIALSGSLVDVANLVVSAPNGSIDITDDASRRLTVGDAAGLLAGTAVPMQAATSAVLRSTGGSIDLLDGPLAGSGGARVRVATTANLPAAYRQNVPGTQASTLTATNPGSINDLALGGVAGIDGVTNLQLNDRVLVRSQTAGRENGIYIVSAVGDSLTPWVLTRAPDADVTGELPGNVVATPQEGGQAGAAFTLSYTDVVGTTPISATVVPNRPGASTVRVATTDSLPGAYANAGGTITSVDPVSGLAVNAALPLIDGVQLALGDRLLVRSGTHTALDTITGLPSNSTQASNGIYTVTSLGGAAAPWVLTRATDASTAATIPGFVNVREGTISTPNLGGVYRVAFDSLGSSNLNVQTLSPLTNIGSDALGRTVTFVVSSNGGTNSSGGSLGKMLALRQANDTSSSAINPKQQLDFRFSTAINGRINLTQQLPAITGGRVVQTTIDPTTQVATESKAFPIDGTRRYQAATSTGGGIVIDGSRISQTRTGAGLFQGTIAVNRVDAQTLYVPPTTLVFNSLRPGMLVSGTAILPGTRVVAIDRATGRFTLSAGSVSGTGFTSVTFSPEINGLDVTGADANGTVITNLSAGGFAYGAAVKVAGARDVAVRAVQIGQDTAGNRSDNGYGVLVGEGGAATVANAAIGASSIAGIATEGTLGTLDNPTGADGKAVAHVAGSSVVVFGSTIGSTNLRNVVGVSLGGNGIVELGREDQARNAIQFNRTGVIARNGDVRILNNTVDNSTDDGIRIDGGSYTIGNAVRSATSNVIAGSGRFGVSVDSTGTNPAIRPANPQVDGRRIRNNFFNVTTDGIATASGNRNDVAAGGTAAAAALGFNADPNTQLDAFANLHGVPTQVGPVDPDPNPNPDPNPDPNPNPNPQPVVPRVTVLPTAVVEGAGATAVFTLRVTGDVTQPFTLRYATKDGTARSPSAYRPNSGTLTIVPGQSQTTISVAVFDNRIPEIDRTFSLVVSAVNPGDAYVNGPINVTAKTSSAEVAGTILDDDSRTISVRAATPTVVAGAPATFTISLDRLPRFGAAIPSLDGLGLPADVLRQIAAKLSFTTRFSSAGGPAADTVFLGYVVNQDGTISTRQTDTRDVATAASTRRGVVTARLSGASNARIGLPAARVLVTPAARAFAALGR